MYAKIQISGIIEVITGMHIGGSNAFSAIGAIDSPVIRDSLSGLPMIPGSSLKGKMRHLLAKSMNTSIAQKPDEDNVRIIRLFGAANGKNNKAVKGRLLFTDAIMSNSDELYSLGLERITEIKFENSINRCTAVANPRQIERVIRGSKFPLELVYEIDKGEEFEEDMDTIVRGMKLLEKDYLGGSGSRGYGRIEFKDVSVKVVIGDVSDAMLESCINKLSF